MMEARRGLGESIQEWSLTGVCRGRMPGRQSGAFTVRLTVPLPAQVGSGKVAVVEGKPAPPRRDDQSAPHHSVAPAHPGIPQASQNCAVSPLRRCVDSYMTSGRSFGSSRRGTWSATMAALVWTPKGGAKRSESRDHERTCTPMTSSKILPLRAQAEVQRILASRMFGTGCDDTDTAAHLRYAMRHVALQGLWLEFGVSTGASLRVIAEQAGARVYGFDSFEGLPADWVRGEGRPTLRRGSFRGSPEVVAPHVTLVPGLFVNTLPRFVEKTQK